MGHASQQHSRGHHGGCADKPLVFVFLSSYSAQCGQQYPASQRCGVVKYTEEGEVCSEGG